MKKTDECIRLGVLSRIAGTKRDGFVVYEAESSYRGFKAIRNAAEAAYGDGFVGNDFIGNASHDSYHFDAYWEWMGTDYRKIFLFHDGAPIAYGLLSKRYAANDAIWKWFYEYHGKSDKETRNAICGLDGKLTRRSVLKDCYDYCTISTAEDLEKALERGNERERIAAAYAMDNGSMPNDCPAWDSLAADESWKVRKALAQCDLLPGRTVDMLLQDGDWRVRMGLCLSCSATCPWMSNEMSEGRWNAVKTMLDDPVEDVRVTAAIVVVNAIPGPSRNSALSRMAGMRDERLKTEALLAVMSVKAP